MISIAVQKQIDLHKEGLSSYEIARLVQRDPSTIRHNLMRYGALRKNTGYEPENLVEAFFKRQGMFTVRQKGDAPFDLIVGKDFCDVKASSPIKNTNRPSKSFRFQLQDYREKKVLKDFKNVDWFLLVFMDDDMGWPLYRARPSDIETKKTLTIPYSLKCKYPIQFVGYLKK